MSENFLKKFLKVSSILLIGILAALAALLANVEIKDLDLWLHLAVGKFILENRFVPDVDLLSSTMAGRSWVNHEWFFQMVSAWVDQQGGAEGLIAMQVVVVALTFLLLVFLGYDRGKPFACILPLFLLVFVYKDRFTIRPDLFSLLFLTITLCIIFRQLHRSWAFPVLFLIQVLWVNTHGFFIWGPLVVLILLVGEGLNRLVPAKALRNIRLSTESRVHRLQMAGGLLVLACFFNPLGLKGVWYPVKIFFQFFGESKVFFDAILELQSPFRAAEIFSLNEYLPYKLLIVLSFLSFIANRRRLDTGLIGLWCVFLLFSFSAIRNLVYFGFIAYFISSVNFAEGSLSNFVPTKNLSFRFRYGVALVINVLLMGHSLGYLNQVSWNGYFNFETYERKSEFGGVSLRNFPKRAVNFLVDNQVHGNFFNDFNSGAYLVGRCFPQIKVTIDGRTELYGPEFFKRHELVWKGDQTTFEEFVEDYNLTGVFLGSMYAPAQEKLVWNIFNRKEWVMVYFDYDALIFLKDIPANKKIIDRYRVNIRDWQTQRNDLEKIGLRRVEPYPNVNRAYALASLQRFEAARAEAAEALRVLPNYAKAYMVLGYIARRENEFDKAFEYFRQAKILDPSNPEVRYQLARVFEEKKDFQKAIAQAQKAVQNNPRNSLGILLLARLYTQTGQYSQAIQILRGLSEITVLDLEDLLAVADLLYERNQFVQAKSIYETALGAKRDQGTILYKIGLCYLGAGEKAQAQREWQKALTFVPGNKEIKKSLENLNGM